jgi:hypothetical protein
MTIVLLVLVWVMLGLTVGLYEARRGHWRWVWLTSALAGPLAISLARKLEENEPLAHPIDISAGDSPRSAGIRLLAGLDGSDDSIAAVRSAASLFGARLGDLTLATVATYDIHELPEEAVRSGRFWSSEYTDILRKGGSELGPWLTFEPSTVILCGQPATALAAHAATGLVYRLDGLVDHRLFLHEDRAGEAGEPSRALRRLHVGFPGQQIEGEERERSPADSEAGELVILGT